MASQLLASLAFRRAAKVGVLDPLGKINGQPGRGCKFRFRRRRKPARDHERVDRAHDVVAYLLQGSLTEKGPNHLAKVAEIDETVRIELQGAVPGMEDRMPGG